MKFVSIAVVVAMLGAAAFVQALPAPDVSHLQPPVVPLLEHTEIRDEAGQYAFSYLTGDGIAVTQQGVLKPNKDGTDNVLVVQGTYSYIGTDGKTYTISYVADENGYQPTGEHLPVAPVVPAVAAQ